MGLFQCQVVLDGRMINHALVCKEGGGVWGISADSITLKILDKVERPPKLYVSFNNYLPFILFSFTLASLKQERGTLLAESKRLIMQSLFLHAESK